MVNALIITGYGINCEEEMAAAYRLAGARAEIVHLNRLLAQEVSLFDYQVLNFPGGFSFGDDLGAGKVLANKLHHRPLASGHSLLSELARYIAEGGFVLGICNGFQALVKMGLLPNLSGRFEQEVSLTCNDSGHFEDRWCTLKKSGGEHSPFLAGLTTFDVPVRHKEGKLLCRDEQIRRQLVSLSLNCLTYCHEDGTTASDYPALPNGAELSCAGLCDRSGRVLGLMPHPEAYLSLYNHPDWHAQKRRQPQLSEDGAGLTLFRNIVRHLTQPSPSKLTPV